MARPKVKTELPPFVSSYRDRHGKMRYRFRRLGRDAGIKAELGTPEFDERYQALLGVENPEPAWANTTDCVYFITDGAAVKIGYAASPKERMKAHQTSCARRLRLMAVAKGGIGLERLYHKRFAAHRIRGEWFEIHEDILAEVARLRLTKGAQPPAELP